LAFFWFIELHGTSSKYILWREFCVLAITTDGIVQYKKNGTFESFIGKMRNLKVLKCFNCFIINPKILSGITNLETIEFSVGVASQWNGILSE
jgi:hypothetical protein